MHKFGKYIVYGAMIGGAIVLGQILGEALNRLLVKAENNLKDDETNATQGEMREAIISEPLGSAELCAFPSAWCKRRYQGIRVSMPYL